MPIPLEKTTHRLDGFPEAQVDLIRGRMGAIPTAPWPRLEGCLAALATSRTGSTYLTRELETAFDISRMRESLNPAQMKGRAAAEIVAQRRGAWFAFKADWTSVIAAELSGFFDAYFSVTSFILLARRDIVAQAVSCVKAKQTGQWHSNQKSTAAAVYDGADIARYISLIAGGVDILRLYAERSGRPWRSAVYEDFAQGDFTLVMAACDSLGVPRRRAGSHIRPMPVERIGDATNEAWAARFREDAGPPIRDRIERYVARVNEVAS
ncbi:MAG: Stf0 family sulfotransferase [Pseudomonadota bacterium]|nr:Stf0 family sulfotransferase [Pseudomonadota bacterium]